MTGCRELLLHSAPLCSIQTVSHSPFPRSGERGGALGFTSKCFHCQGTLCPGCFFAKRWLGRACALPKSNVHPRQGGRYLCIQHLSSHGTLQAFHLQESLCPPLKCSHLWVGTWQLFNKAAQRCMPFKRESEEGSHRQLKLHIS